MIADWEWSGHTDIAGPGLNLAMLVGMAALMKGIFAVCLPSMSKA